MLCRLTARNEIGRLLGDHDRGGDRVGEALRRHQRRIGYTRARDPTHLHLPVPIRCQLVYPDLHVIEQSIVSQTSTPGLVPRETKGAMSGWCTLFRDSRNASSMTCLSRQIVGDLGKTCPYVVRQALGADFG